MRAKKKKRFIVPEVVQTSAMDCGPASLKCLLEGFGISVSYGRLREACQTDVDGTSIDSMEEIACQLGLNAEQVMVPLDHVLLPETKILPAIVVVVLPSGLTHFLVVWKRHGDLIQVMDPGTGRRWIRANRFLEEIYIHATAVPAEDWREWAETDEFTDVLRLQLKNLGVVKKERCRLVEEAIAAPGWRGIATLDATLRMVASLIRNRALKKGSQAAGVLSALFNDALGKEGHETDVVPETYWFVRPAPEDEEGEPQLLMRGAVLVRAAEKEQLPIESSDQVQDTSEEQAALPAEIVAALEEKPTRPGREILKLLRADGLMTPFALSFAFMLASMGVLVQALLFRGLLDIGARLNTVEQRVGAVAVLIIFMVAVLLLDLSLVSAVMRLGRHLEVRLRTAFLSKIPRLVDRYFHSRLTSDMAERCHNIQSIRSVVYVGHSLLRSVFELLLTTLGLIWLDPKSAPLALTTAFLAIAVPLAIQRTLNERDLRVRSHYASLTRFYLDALLGLTALKTHSAERAIRREHESLLVEWLRASIGLLRASVTVETVQAFVGMGLAGWLILAFLGRTGGSQDVLLFVYWALNLPTIGSLVAREALRYPALRNLTLRLLEPLGAPERDITETDEKKESGSPPDEKQTGGVSIEMNGVEVKAAGNTILENIDLSIPKGQHVAVVGVSGAGKSSLVGLLLGWHTPSVGQIRVDGANLDTSGIEQLRLETAWVDPAVQLWNRPLLRNLLYGTQTDTRLPVQDVIAQANLKDVLENMPEGLQTPLGEGGGLVSGGEGQRVRFGRALLRPNARLAILDEPFRGLDRAQRRVLLKRSRDWWADATLICVTHDVSETVDFGRVIVIENGQIVEEGSPAKLAAHEGSRYRDMLDAEAIVRGELWTDKNWQRLWLENGELKGQDMEGIELTEELSRYAWPGHRLSEAVEALTGFARLPVKPIEMPPSPQLVGPDQARQVTDWLSLVSSALGIEAESVETSYSELGQLLRGASPAIMMLSGHDVPLFLVLLGRRGTKIKLLGPDRRIALIKISEVREVIAHQIEAPFAADVDLLLERARVPASKKARAKQAILNEWLAKHRIGGCWILRLQPGAGLFKQMLHARLPRRLVAFFVAHIASYMVMLVSWLMVGRTALDGHIDGQWLLAWFLILITQVPLGLIVSWSEGMFAIGIGGLFKKRLLSGALKLEPEEIRHQGAGQLLGRVIESGALESMALAAGFSGLTAIIDLLGAGVVLGIGPGGGLRLILFAGWIVLTFLVGRKYYRRDLPWTEARVEMTNDLVERMVGHRTRMAQERAEDWHDGEDQFLARYLDRSRRLDNTWIQFSVFLSRGWLLFGFFGLVPVFFDSAGDRLGMAVALGGILLASRALGTLSESLGSLTSAAVAWKQAGPIYKAAGRTGIVGTPEVQVNLPRGRQDIEDGKPLIEAHDLTFRYRPQGEAVLKGCSLRVKRGERVLLEGPSGGGKTTLASILVGLREPEGGLLLLDGLDRQTLGSQGWRRQVVAAPQFHENHVMTATFAFNLLMGRRWPPEYGDVEEAEQICRELGLGPLIDRMPAGLLQIVGETGWRLSHGEKSRLFIARALLQTSELIVLDESFAALDPESLKSALQCVQRRAGTLLVIAHP